jgi:hypothetical protein
MNLSTAKLKNMINSNFDWALCIPSHSKVSHSNKRCGKDYQILPNTTILVVSTQNVSWDKIIWFFYKSLHINITKTSIFFLKKSLKQDEPIFFKELEWVFIHTLIAIQLVATRILTCKYWNLDSKFSISS